MKTMLLMTFLALIMSSCVQEESTSNKLSSSEKNPDVYTPRDAITYQADFVITPYIAASYPDASDVINSAFPPNPRFIKLAGPNWLVVNNLTGEFEIQSLTNQPPSSFQIQVYENGNPTNKIDSSVLTIALNGDPLRAQQWHIENDGTMKAYSLRSGSFGIDLNLSEVYKAGFTGDGVRIAISDSGAEINHDDFVGNILNGVHKDYTLSPPYLGTPTPTSAHGTAVGGIIGARGWNNKGGTGVAPFASLGFFQFLSSSQSTGVLIDQASGNFKIFNYSYGDTLLFDAQSDQGYVDHLRHETQVNNKFFIKAAGNEFSLAEGSLCAPHNANSPLENESPFQIVVGALDANGEKAVYSNAGSNIWISALGGDYGSTDPAIVTTDLPTCFKGYSKASNVLPNEFEYGHPANPYCDYTSTMNGTSAATPMISGVIALILEANPTLSNRDVKHILAMTAQKNDPNHDSVFGVRHPSRAFVSCTDLNLTNHDYELGWVENDADIYFNNFYGFGLADAKAAVSLAQDFNQPALDPLQWLPLPALVETNPNFNIGAYDSDPISLGIPDNSALGISDTISIAANMKVESIVVRVQATHSKSGQLGVELTSPAGTKSILMNINNSFILDSDQNLNIDLASHAFYGEDAAGDWTLKLIDGRSGNTGIFTRWKINILGH